MSNYNKEGVFMNNWHKCPNSIIDRVAGDILSPTACVIVMTVMRYTWGMSDRQHAQIPHKVFSQKTGIKRAETLGKYIDECIDSGIIIAERKNGKVTKYSINMASEHISGVPNLDDKTSTEKPVRIISTSTDDLAKPVRKNRTRTTTENPYSNKDISNKENNKDKKNKQKKDSQVFKPQKPDEVSDQVWSDLISHRKIKKTSNTQTAWNVIFSQLEKAKQATGHSLDQIITEWITRDWKGFKSDWYINIQNKTQSTGNHHAINQPANNQASGNNQAISHFDQLRAEIRAKYGSSQQSSDIRTVSTLT